LPVACPWASLAWDMWNLFNLSLVNQETKKLSKGRGMGNFYSSKIIHLQAWVNPRYLYLGNIFT
jgi:hypothetical protein